MCMQDTDSDSYVISFWKEERATLCDMDMMLGAMTALGSGLLCSCIIAEVFGAETYYPCFHILVWAWIRMYTN